MFRVEAFVIVRECPRRMCGGVGGGSWKAGLELSRFGYANRDVASGYRRG